MSKESDTLFEELLQDLPENLIQMARDFKAFTRERKVKNPTQLLRVVFLYCGLDKTLREVAGNFSLLEEKLTDTAVSKRLQACRPWVKALLTQMFYPRNLSNITDQFRILVIDGSSIQAPGSKGTDYRLHISMNLITLEITEIFVTTKKIGENLRHFSLSTGDIALVDRGYFYISPISDAVNSGANVIARFNYHNVQLFHSIKNVPIFHSIKGVPINLVNELKNQEHMTTVSFSVMVCSPKDGNQISGWLHCYRLSEEQANRVRQKRLKECRREGTTPKEDTLFLDGWVFVFTTIDPEIISGQQIIQLYRTRWQVELAIKRFKSILNVDELRAKEGSPLADLWLHGKLLYALLLDRITRRINGDKWACLDQERDATWWRLWKMMQDKITPMITGSQFWPEDWKNCQDVLKERPRKRKLQRVSEEAIDGLKIMYSNVIKNYLNAA